MVVCDALNKKPQEMGNQGFEDEGGRGSLRGDGEKKRM